MSPGRVKATLVADLSMDSVERRVAKTRFSTVGLTTVPSVAEARLATTPASMSAWVTA